MKKKKLLSEALHNVMKNFNEKNRLQKLAGISDESEGCLAESLDPNSNEGAIFMESMKSFVNVLNGALNEAEEFVEACLKNVDIEGGTATGCSASCKGGCARNCDCYKAVGASAVAPTRKMRNEGPTMAGGTCIKNVKQSGFMGMNISFETCGKCTDKGVCPSGCTCIAKVS
tara:strand:+ start:1110 stop:1625 length:516 start_codon:yes stop_codon:yes gene_type:complete